MKQLLLLLTTLCCGSMNAQTLVINEIMQSNIECTMDDIKECKMKHGVDATDFDEASWEEINRLRFEIAKDSTTGKSLLTRAREALDMKDYDAASDMQIVIQTKVEELKKKYADYKRNLF